VSSQVTTISGKSGWALPEVWHGIKSNINGIKVMLLNISLWHFTVCAAGRT
jgi:hypothetical protein